jgi:hypothetical protein
MLSELAQAYDNKNMPDNAEEILTLMDSIKPA